MKTELKTQEKGAKISPTEAIVQMRKLVYLMLKHERVVFDYHYLLGEGIDAEALKEHYPVVVLKNPYAKLLRHVTVFPEFRPDKARKLQKFYSIVWRALFHTYSGWTEEAEKALNEAVLYWLEAEFKDEFAEYYCPCAWYLYTIARKFGSPDWQYPCKAKGITYERCWAICVDDKCIISAPVECSDGSGECIFYKLA